jgi:hypothetical protein
MMSKLFLSGQTGKIHLSISFSNQRTLPPILAGLEIHLLASGESCSSGLSGDSWHHPLLVKALPQLLTECFFELLVSSSLVPP